MRFVSKLQGAGDKIVGARGSAVETARGRLLFVSFVMLCAFSVIGIRIAYLCLYQQGAEPRYEALRAAKGGVEADRLALGRADVVDRNGVLLATTLPTISLYADPKLVKDANDVAQGLKSVFADMDLESVKKRLEGRGRFVWIRRGITPEEARAVIALGYPALNIRNENRRFYPQETLLSHVIGYTDIDGSGLAGIERGMDAVLREGGEPLELTIDVRYQHALRRALAEQMAVFNAAGATGVVMDVHTGAVLAAVSLPDYDPHVPTDSDDNARFNRFALGVYEMGSTFKAFTAAAYMEAAGTSFNKHFDAKKPLVRGRFRIPDFQAKNRVLSFPEAMMYSSNIAMVLMAEKVGLQEFRTALGRFGLFDNIEGEIAEKASIIMPKPWRDISSVSASYGYGVAVTPLHIVRAYGAVANGGVLPELHFVKRAHSPKDKVQTRVMDEKISEAMRRMLRMVISQGTGGRADVPGMNVAGKTGTAQKNINGKYVKDKRFSSFAGFFPADNPRYAVLVALDDPQGTRETHGFATAGWVAAPAMASVVGAIRDIENMPYSGPEMDLEINKQIAPLVEGKLKPIKTPNP